MSTPATELLRAWQEAIRQMTTAGGMVPDQAELMRGLLAPMEQQTELFRRALAQQAALQQELVRPLLAPIDALAEQLDRTAAPLRTQVEAFEQAARSFAQAAEVLSAQLGLVEEAGRSLRAQADAVRGLAGAGAR